jgi:glycosyltransferase involved in cell wall biosynthesis
MKILQLCHKPPCPPKDGGCIAMNNLTQGLIKQNCQVKVLSIHTHKHDFEPQNLSEEYKQQTAIESIFVDTRINLVDAFSNLITQDSYNVSRFFSADFDKKLRSILQSDKFDVVLLESLFMTPYTETIRRYSKAKVILRSHNLEYVIWDRVAEGSRNPAKKTYLRLLAKQLKEYELKVFKNVDGIVAISTADEQKYRQLGFEGNLITIPFGIDIENIIYREYQEKNQIFHLGSMDWTPNIEGVEWFLTQVWPKAHKDNPKVELWLAGREMPDEMKLLKEPNLNVVGSVGNAYEFMREKGIMIVPLLSAGGIRVKIIEGMALGIPIISTAIGAEGIDYKDQRDIIIANTPNEFATAIKKLTKEPEYAKSIGANARKLIENQFDNNLLTKKLLNFFNMAKA